ncbi:MAG: hypothetical protein WBD16_00335 [Pyrinomonadaceae bacterium]
MNAYIRRDPDPGKYRRPWFIEVSQIIDNPGARAAWETAAHVEKPAAKKPPPMPTP